MMLASPSSPIHALWPGEPLILASKSAGRARLLANAGIPFVPVDSGLDERNLETQLDLAPPDLALRLAVEKANSASRSYPNRIVLGADQTMALGDEVMHKARDRAHAVTQLKRMRGRSHRLHSAIALVRDGQSIFTNVSTATITLRDFSDSYANAYADAMGDGLLHTVGAYEIEGLGINLMQAIDGDYFTIVGLPLLPLLAYCRDAGLIAEEGFAT